MSFTSAEFQDLLKLLEQRPEWRAELRRLLLTEELLALPEIVRELSRALETLNKTVEALVEGFRSLEGRVSRLEEIVAVLVEAQRRTEEQLAALAESHRQLEGRVARLEEVVAQLTQEVTALAHAQRRTEQQITVLVSSVDSLTRRVDAISQDVGRLKGFHLQLEYERHAPAYFRALARKIRVLSCEELSALLDRAVEEGRLADSDADEIIHTDIVIRGRHPEEGGEVYLLVEVSWGIGLSDVERAARRALLLSQAGMRTIPVVAGESITDDAGRLAQRLNVWQVIDGRAIPPTPLSPETEEERPSSAS